MGKISVVINTLNEEKNLPGALKSIKDFADEIVVVDMHSTDSTVKIAKKAGAKTYLHKKTIIVEPARNFAISKATGDWILILDADERLTPILKKKLKAIAKKPQADYYRIPRKNIIFGKWIKHSRWWPDMNIRFFKKGHVDWSEVIHSVPVTTGKGMDLAPHKSNAIIHENYKSIEQYIERMNRYTTVQAKLKISEKHQFLWIDLIKKPTSEFLGRYFQGEGYKDGIHGLGLSGLQAFSEFVLYLKIWFYSDKITREKHLDVNEVISEIKRSEKDVHYWTANVLLSKGGGFIQRLKRKFRLL